MAQIYDRRLVSPISEQAPTYEQGSLPPRQHYSSYTVERPSSPSRKHRWPLPEQSRSPRFNHEESVHEPVAAQAPEAMYQSRPQLSQKASREQLPSLSSLFGSAASHTPRSPFLESPHDTRHAETTPGYTERSYNESYFHRPPPSWHSSHNPAPEHVERHSIQPPPRPAQTAIRAGSPRYDPRYRPSESSRTYPSSSGSSWSPQPQAVHMEYPSRDTSSSFRAFPDESRPHQPPVHRPEPALHTAYLDGHNAPVTPNYPPTPASTVGGEAATKEALGPKIWTGTQFLPRFVKQAEVPGEGMCYFYDDGTHCKTVIDGEVVNAHWGVTKAGKPRKRLAIACITCREKKIKCDPDFPRCVQCEKFGRVCKFKNAPRGGQGSPDTPPTEPEENLQRPLSSRTDGEPFKLENSEPPHAGSPRQKHCPATPDSELNPAKRQRNGYTHFTPVASETSPLASAREGPSPWKESPMISTGPHNLLREWQVNPHSTHPELVSDLINEFFKRLPESLYRMFPERVFKLWALSPGEKSLDDLMLIYTILAVGTIFSPKPEHKPLGAHFASIARYACENRKFCIQLVQARLFLSIYYYAINNANDAWDFFGAAMRAASALKLNLEMEKTADANLLIFPYNLSRDGYAECRRRTFWYCFLLDRYNSFCSGQVCAINQEDVFLRLPCDTDSFESQAHFVNPFFDPATTPIETLSTKLGSLAYTISIATIWGEVTANIYRSSQRLSPPGPNPTFTALYERTMRRLHEWETSLPARYRFSAVNVERAAVAGKTGAFLRMHAIFHTTSMLLNRYVQHSILTPGQLAHHNTVAATHAEALLRMLDAVVVDARRVSGVSSASPFVGYCIVTAVDIMSRRVRRGAIRELLVSFTAARQVLDDLAVVWQQARYQQGLVTRRVRELEDLLVEADGREDEGEVLEIREGIEQIWPREMDCVYQ